MTKTIKGYDIDRMIEVVTDRAYDYSDIMEEYEEDYAGEIEVNPDKCYEYGYGKTLDDVILLLGELKKFTE